MSEQVCYEFGVFGQFSRPWVYLDHERLGLGYIRANAGLETTGLALYGGGESERASTVLRRVEKFFTNLIDGLPNEPYSGSMPVSENWLWIKLQNELRDAWVDTHGWPSEPPSGDEAKELLRTAVDRLCDVYDAIFDVHEAILNEYEACCDEQDDEQDAAEPEPNAAVSRTRGEVMSKKDTLYDFGVFGKFGPLEGYLALLESEDYELGQAFRRFDSMITKMGCIEVKENKFERASTFFRKAEKYFARRINGVKTKPVTGGDFLFCNRLQHRLRETWLETQGASEQPPRGDEARALLRTVVDKLCQEYDAIYERNESRRLAEARISAAVESLNHIKPAKEK
jgi:hypothetical protein